MYQELEPTDPQLAPNTKNSKVSSLSKKKLFLFIFLLAALCVAISAGIINSLSSGKTEILTKKTKTDEYSKIVREQEMRNKARKPSIEPVFARKALGNHTLHIIYTKPASLNGNTVSKLIDALNYTGENIRDKCVNGNCYQAVSLNYIKEYLNKEKNIYGVRDFEITIKTHPLLNMEDLHKVGDVALLWDKDTFGITKLKDGFEKTLKQNSINIPEGDLVAFLYLDDSFDHNTDASDRFYEHKKFRSFADFKYGKTYLNIYNFEESFSAIVVEILTHELLHLFGATDKYEEYDPNRRCSLKGLGNPDLAPLYPQTQADIMCMYIEKSANNFTRGYLVNSELIINKFTAGEIGWEE